MAKLRAEDGLYLIHWSTGHLDRLILTVAQRDQVGLGRGSWAGAGRTPCLDPRSPPPSLPPTPRHLACSTCTCGNSPLSCGLGALCWRAGTAPSPACGSYAPPCRAALCGPGTTVSPCAAAACRGPEVWHGARGGTRGGGGGISPPPCQPMVMPLEPPELSNLIITRGSRASSSPLNLSQLSFHRVCRDDISQVGAAGAPRGMGAATGEDGLGLLSWRRSVPCPPSCPTWAKAQGPMCMRASYEWGEEAPRRARPMAGTPPHPLGTVGRSCEWYSRCWTPVTTTSPW